MQRNWIQRHVRVRLSRMRTRRYSGTSQLEANLKTPTFRGQDKYYLFSCFVMAYDSGSGGDVGRALMSVLVVAQIVAMLETTQRQPSIRQALRSLRREWYHPNRLNRGAAMPARNVHTDILRFFLLSLFAVYLIEAAITVPAAVTVARPSYARYLFRRVCVRPQIRQASFNATNCDYWTAFCGNDSSLSVWPEQQSLVSTYLCIPGDPPYTFGNNSYGQCTPYTFNGIQQVPTVTNVAGVTQVTVPCNYPADTALTGVATPKLLASPAPATVTSQYVWYLSVVASSNGDFSPNYIAPDGTGGFKTTNQRPPFDTVQVISVFVQDPYTNFLSNAINITFVLRTCQLRITGPAAFQVCNSLPTGVTIPGANYQITPVPPGPGTSAGSTTIVWGDPVLISSTNGDTIDYVEAQQGGTFQTPTSVTTGPDISEVQIYNFTATDSAAGSNYIEAWRLITVIINAGC